MNKTELKRRLVIGSANFTQKYGVNLSKIKNKEINKIIYLAKKNDIYKIDTAKAYLKNKFIFQNIDKKFEFFTKVSPNSKWVSLDFCKKHIKNHLKYFTGHKVNILFFHDIKILYTKDGKKIFNNLEILRKKKFFKKIGLSIYDPKCLEYITSNYNFDVIQCPFNIIDNRIITSGWYDKLKKRNKEIHIRSIFLQGLLVNKLLYKKLLFIKWKDFFTDWFEYLQDENINPVDYCLNEILKYDFDQIVIGVNNSDNFKKILNFKKINKNKMINFRISDRKLIDPRKWK